MLIHFSVMSNDLIKTLMSIHLLILSYVSNFNHIIHVYLNNIYVYHTEVYHTHTHTFELVFSSHSRFFHSFGDVTITDEGLKFLPIFGIHGHWAVRVLKSVDVTPTATRANLLLWSSPRTRSTYNCCRVFGSVAVITCFKDFGLSRPGIEPWPPRMRCERTSSTPPPNCYQIT